MDYTVHGILQARILGVGSHSLLQAGDLPKPGTEPRSPALQVDSLPSEPPGKPKYTGVDKPIPSPGDLPDPRIQYFSATLLTMFRCVRGLRWLFSLNLALGGFLAAPPLISNSWNPPFGIQGRSWRLESCLQETGDEKKGFYAQEPTWCSPTPTVSPRFLTHGNYEIINGCCFSS